MDVSREALLDELNDFEKKRPNDISPLLEEFLLKIAKCGDTMFPWSKFKLLIRRKLEVVMSDFYEDCPTDNLPPVPNVEIFKYETMKSKILEAVDSFQSTPFTIQRLCELLTSPRQHYKRTDKFMRGIEKNILVVSTVEPRHPELNNNNNNNGSMVVNGILDVNSEGDMLVSGQMDNDNHRNNNNNNNNSSSMFGQQDRVTVNGVPIPDNIFSTDPSSSTSTSSVTTSLGVTPEIESSSEDSSDGSTDSGGDYVLKESPLDVMTDIATAAMPSSTSGASCLPLETNQLRGDDKNIMDNMENSSEVEEQARQLLSQVAANIEESSLLVESTQDSPKFPVSSAIIDTSLELGFTLGKDLSNECGSSEDPKSPSGLNGQFSSSGFSNSEESPLEATVGSSSPSAVPGEVDSIDVSPSEMEPGILSQMTPCPEDSIDLQPDCTIQNVDVCSSSMNIEEPCETSDKMDTESMAVDEPSSTTFDDAQCLGTSEEKSVSEAQMSSTGESTALGEDPPDLPDLEDPPMPCPQQEELEQEQEEQPPQQQWQSRDEPMDQD